MKTTLDTSKQDHRATPSHSEEVDRYPEAAYAWYVVAVLTLAYIVSFIDRQILSLMVDSIRRDLAISEKQMSLLMGLSFTVFYSFLGIPLGRLADTHSRRAIISVGIAVWSVMTAGCGLARGFWQLALARMGVGVGEASLSPSAYSLISDYFRPARRSTAMSVYSMGIYIGSGLAFVLGGLVISYTSGRESFVLPFVGAMRSWQIVFLAVGLPGLLVALLLLTIREPARKETRAARGEGTDAGSSAFTAVGCYVLANRTTFLYLNLGIAMIALYGYGATSWVPTLFMRRHGWSPGQTGLVFGLIVAVFGTVGIVTGGFLADRLRGGGHADANVRVALLAAAAGLPSVVAFPLVPAAHWAAAVLSVVVFFMSMPFGVAPAAIQQMMPNAMRAQATAVYLFVINLIGLGLGPTVVATLTEDVFRDKRAVHYSLLTVGALAYVAAIILLGLGLGPYRRSLDFLKNWGEGTSSTSAREVRGTRE
jgi:MFS family permease